jgi:hypothetical protein
MREGELAESYFALSFQTLSSKFAIDLFLVIPLNPSMISSAWIIVRRPRQIVDPTRRYSTNYLPDLAVPCGGR